MAPAGRSLETDEEAKQLAVYRCPDKPVGVAQIRKIVPRALDQVAYNLGRYPRKRECEMETYTVFPPQNRAAEVPYHVLVEGSDDCAHSLLDNEWPDRISIVDDLVFISYTCQHCGRQISQSLEQLVPPTNWNGRAAHS